MDLYNMIYFLSDAHLGSRLISNPEEHQRRLVNCLREMSTDAEHSTTCSTSAVTSQSSTLSSSL